MIRLHAGEKPTDKTLTVHAKVDRNPLHSNSDEVWMTQEEWFADKQPYAGLPEGTVRDELAVLVTKWHSEAMTHSADQNSWAVKDASVNFYLPEGRYEIRPGDLGNDVDTYMFDRVSDMIEQDLYAAGACYVQYTGMID